jgi:putative CRISPR-associated protein (TIGR02619 family)
MDAVDLSQVQGRIAEIEGGLPGATENEVRRMSAELNGILALGTPAREGLHYLLHTDTYQGAETARLAAEWMRQSRFSVITQVLEGFSTASRAAFSQGIDYLLRWCEETLPQLKKQQHHIIFNLVGSFKSLQAYAQTLGMFYADEVVYLFESKDAELIRIPRLPIAWDTKGLAEHAAAVARLAHGDVLARTLLAGLPEAYLEIDGEDATLSDWGELAWNRNRKTLLAEELLEQPGLIFSAEFRRDYERRRDPLERTALQEALAKTAVLWAAGGLGRLRADGGLRYEEYVNKSGIGHFRINDDLRVSCERADARLRLRHFGPHNYVNDNP